MKSIISNEKVCYLCKTPYGIHKHHIFGAYNRWKSEEYGCWVYLCGPHHNLSDLGVHYNKPLDRELKRLAQTKFEETRSRARFMDIFGKNWL